MRKRNAAKENEVLLQVDTLCIHEGSYQSVFLIPLVRPIYVRGTRLERNPQRKNGTALIFAVPSCRHGGSTAFQFEDHELLPILRHLDFGSKPRLCKSRCELLVAHTREHLAVNVSG